MFKARCARWRSRPARWARSSAAPRWKRQSRNSENSAYAALPWGSGSGYAANPGKNCGIAHNIALRCTNLTCYECLLAVPADGQSPDESMIRKTGDRFFEKIMLKQEVAA